MPKFRIVFTVLEGDAKADLSSMMQIPLEFEESDLKAEPDERGTLAARKLASAVNSLRRIVARHTGIAQAEIELGQMKIDEAEKLLAAQQA